MAKIIISFVTVQTESPLFSFLRLKTSERFWKKDACFSCLGSSQICLRPPAPSSEASKFHNLHFKSRTRTLNIDNKKAIFPALLPAVNNYLIQ